MAFEQATLKGPPNTATRLIRWGLAVGLQRQRLKEGCGGLTYVERAAHPAPAAQQTVGRARYDGLWAMMGFYFWRWASWASPAGSRTTVKDVPAAIRAQRVAHAHAFTALGPAFLNPSPRHRYPPSS
jgi:hypothetical protein